MSGRKLIEQAVQEDKSDSVLEDKDHQEDNTSFFTLAREKLDNV